MENLIEELRKVNPSNLSEEGLKLFNKINEIIDRNRELEEMLKNRIKYTNELEKDLFENASNYVIPKSLIKEKIEELKAEYKIALEENSTKAFILKCQIQVLEELLVMEDSKDAK